MTRVLRPVPIADEKVFRLQVPHGAVTLEPASVDAVEIELVARCSGSLAPCRDDARELDVVREERDGMVVASIVGPDSYGFGGKLVSRFFNARSSIAGKQYRGGREGHARGGWRLEVDVRVRVPRRQPVELLLGEGVVTIERLDAAARLEVGEGRAEVKMPRRLVSTVELRAKKGRASLEGIGRDGLKGKTVEWDGDGSHALVATVDRGDVAVRLTNG